MWPDGKMYEGEFKNDECHGKGTLYYPDGKRFEGDWKEGKKHGSGHYHWPNGQRFNVFYQDGVKKGEGYFEQDGGQTLDWLKDQYGSMLKKTKMAKDHMDFVIQKAEPIRRAKEMVKEPTLKGTTPKNRRF